MGQFCGHDKVTFLTNFTIFIGNSLLSLDMLPIWQPRGQRKGNTKCGKIFSSSWNHRKNEYDIKGLGSNFARVLWRSY